MSKKLSDIFLKIGIIVLSAIIWVFIGWAILNAFQTHQKGPRQEIMPRVEGYYLLEENSLKALASPVLITPQILGISAFGLDYKQAKLLNDLWFCEASLKHDNVWGDNNMAYGGFQFWETTWDSYCQGSRYALDNQIQCASYMIFKLKIGPKHWQRCWKAMDLEQYQ